MSLRPLLELAAEHERFRSLARAVREGGSVPVHMSGSIQPYLLAALVEVTDSDPAVVVASAVALAEAVPDAELRPAGLTLERGTEVDLGEVAALLVEAGYEHIDQVEERGQFAVRGGILDVFPATE